MPRRKGQSSTRVTARSGRVHLRRQPTMMEKLAAALTGFFGSLAFLFFNLALFIFWIVWNSGVYPALQPFDSHPFGILTMIVSLEAIVLSIIVLISQNHSNKVADAREQIDFEVDVASEKQIAAMMQSLDLILHRLNVKHTEDRQAMRAVNLDRLERRVMSEIDTD